MNMTLQTFQLGPVPQAPLGSCRILRKTQETIRT
jgi:hypothetical protein